ncbi:MAG TPA: GNAT family N-acetyltransferase, partial [Ornithinibacter sp.]|nr:GNAT family N-acetyltransferase [Ornithinibacter sp.]
AHQRAAKGSAGVDPEAVLGQLVGTGSWTRRQVLVHDPAGRLVAWLSVHDRASGRTLVEVTVTPDLPDEEAAAVAAALFGAGERHALDIARMRGLGTSLLDSGAYADDPRQQGWLAAAGFEQTRTWLQMSRPVAPEEATTVPAPREGVTVRPVERHDDGLPVAQDLQDVHRVLEESFQDHFSSYRESFPEFVMRLREDPGHRWDHWWLATIDTDEGVFPAGALVSTVLREDAAGFEGSYVDYIGVHRRARGRGVAKALLHTAIADAARRGRNRVGLEVDADSPTGADGLYTSMGWVTDYRTQSWHRELDLRDRPQPE